MNGAQIRINSLGIASAQKLKQQEGISFSCLISLGGEGKRIFANAFGNNNGISLPVLMIHNGPNFLFNRYIAQQASQIQPGVLGINAEIKRPVSLIMGRGIPVINSVSDRVGSPFNLISSIAASDIGPQKHKLIAPIGSNHAGSYKNDIAEGILGRHEIVGSIDTYRYQGNQVINTVICEHGLNAEHNVKNAIDASGRVVTQDIAIWLDGQEITNKVTEGNINLYGNGVLSDFSLNVATDAFLDGQTIKINIGAKSFEFLVEEITQDAGKKTISFWGRSKVAQLYEPWAIRNKYRYKNRLASEIAAEICQGFTLNWQVANYLVRYFEGEMYPLEVVQRLAQAVGGVVRAMPDGQIYVVNPYQNGMAAMNLAWCLSLSREKRVKEADGVKVIYGDKEAAFVTLEANQTEVRPGEWAEVKVYCLNEYTMNSTADVYYRAETGVIEEMEEDVTLEKGEGNLSKPNLELISVSGCQAEIIGQRVYCDEDCKIVTVRYKTKYDLWRLTNHAESKALFCAVETENSVAVLEGTGQNIIAIQEPLINEAGLARIRAEKELIEKKGLWVAKATIPFEEEFTDPTGVVVDTLYGRGVVIGSGIIISAKPLKILNQVEVLLWPA